MHAYPASLESLEAECVERELEVSSFTIPVFALSHGTSSGLRIPLFPLEDKDNACGLSVLPLFYVAGTAQPQFPSLRKIKNELFALQRVSPMPAHCKDKAKVRYFWVFWNKNRRNKGFRSHCTQGRLLSFCPLSG